MVLYIILLLSKDPLKMINWIFKLLWMKVCAKCFNVKCAISDHFGYIKTYL